MDLRQWCESYGKGAIARLAREGLREATLIDVRDGHVPTVRTARRIVDATARVTPDAPCTLVALLGVDPADPATVPDPGAGLRAAAAALGVDPDAETGDVVRALDAGPTEAA